MTGPKANKFLQKVQQAAVGHPWYTRGPSAVNVAYKYVFNLVLSSLSYFTMRHSSAMSHNNVLVNIFQQQLKTFSNSS